MEKKQNSIEWLVQELNRNIDFIPNVHHWDKIRNIIQQAKAMHKEEIEEAYMVGNHSKMRGGRAILEVTEKYYNEKFGESKS